MTKVMKGAMDVNEFIQFVIGYSTSATTAQKAELVYQAARRVTPTGVTEREARMWASELDGVCAGGVQRFVNAFKEALIVITQPEFVEITLKFKPHENPPTACSFTEVMEEVKRLFARAQVASDAYSVWTVAEGTSDHDMTGPKYKEIRQVLTGELGKAK